jgi:hypothetical protein
MSTLAEAVWAAAGVQQWLRAAAARPQAAALCVCIAQWHCHMSTCAGAASPCSELGPLLTASRYSSPPRLNLALAMRLAQRPTMAPKYGLFFCCRSRHGSSYQWYSVMRRLAAGGEEVAGATWQPFCLSVRHIQLR